MNENVFPVEYITCSLAHSDVERIKNLFSLTKEEIMKRIAHTGFNSKPLGIDLLHCEGVPLDIDVISNINVNKYQSKYTWCAPFSVGW